MAQDTPHPEDDIPTRPLIDKGGHLSHWLIGQIREMLTERAGQPLALRFLRWLQRHYLIPAEAVLRRAIHLIADSLDPFVAPPARAPIQPRSSKHPAGQALRKPRAPLFRLTEPAPRLPTDYIPESRRPRISFIDERPFSPVRAPASTGKPLEARFLRRLAALEAAWHDARGYAHRLQRLRARQPLRRLVLSFVKIPGEAAKPLIEEGRSILRELNTAVLTAAADTS